ncbi:Tudor domain-containing protein 1 [Amphibalanus amphitrite]|uniref:Tudor domain-containing protein 1 n=1 Tax=Amphibalanus amphitrite TaxID=1232801 RepID=A0A6A4VTX8_AMPAM|nr:Tudor domain-containing protein 1 [Amphibalanus amphitrite]KAF0298267.1 Tudor domain-containing protein 1 [Amphibalanus amphitrite]
MCDCSLYVTSVTNAGTHISFHAQPNPEQFAVLDRLITQNQAFFEQARLPSPYQLPPGQTVLVKSTSSGAAKWHRARVVGIQGPTVSVEYIDYGTSELAHYTQICASRTALPAAVLTQPPLAVPCVLAEVLPATGTWTEAAFSHAESALRSRQPVQAQVLRQDTDGVWHVRIYTGDGRTLASQLAALGMGRLTTPSGQYPVQAACSPLTPASRGPEPPLAFATRVSELLSVPPLSGSEALVTICHYINGPAKFAVQLYEHQPALLQLMTEIQSYCQSSPPVPLSAVESGVVCLGSSASREGRYLRGVITQADGNVVKVYWADYGNDETKVVSELRAMPRQFTQLRIQASRVTLAGLSALKPVPGRAETIFRQKTEGSVLTGRFDKPRDQPAGAATGSATCLNQVELFDVGESVLEILIREGAYERRSGSAPASRTPPVVAARRSASPPAEPPPLTPGTHAEVRVVSVTSVSSLHVRALDTEPVLQQTLQRLTDALNVSACPLPMVRASEGSLCAVFKDASYQRARVMSVGRRDMKVLYIDLGTSEIIPAGAAFALEQDVANYPPQAVHCCLSGLEMSHGTPELVEQLRALTAGGRLLCEVLDQLGEKRIVRLTDLTRSPPLDVGAMLRGMMSGARRVKQSPSKPPTAAGSPRPAPAAVTVRPPEVELGRPEHISVVYVESAAAFFGQLLSADVDAMYDMEAAMQERYGGAVSPLRPAPVGAFCVGRSTINETFYRAKVLLSASDKVTIQYIDYGDQESKAPSEVFPLLPEFTKLPQLGMFCCLAGGESVPEDTFSRLVQDQTLLVLPVFGSGDHYRVTLPPCSENQPLLAQLKPFGIAAAAVPPPKSPAATNGSVSSPSPRPPSSSPVATTGQPSDTVKLTEPQLPVGLFKFVRLLVNDISSPSHPKQDVTVVHAVSPSEFYVRLREHSDSLARLEAELASYGTAAPAPVTPQQTVAVETAAGWRRGRVNGRKIDQVSVFLLDSGETVSVPMSSVRLLRSEHARLPAQAILCCAKGARPSGKGGWTDEETTQFRGSVAGRSFLARAEEARPGAPAVVTLAQAEPVRATALLHPGSGQQSPRSSDTNNNTTKRTSPPPRADQEVLQTIVHTVTSNGHGGVDLEKRCKLLDLLLKDPNWRDKSTAVPPPSASSGPGWRSSDSRPNGGLRAAERRSSGSSAPAPSPRPPKPSTTSAAAPAAAAAPDEDPEPRLERFVGKMRMDDPAEYAPVSRSSAGRGDGDSSSGRPSSRANGGDTRKPAPPAPSRVEIPSHSATITRRPVPPGAPLAVTPTWVSGLARFYVQRCPAEPEFTSLMEEMQRFYSGLKAEDGQEAQPQTGRPVAARFTDGAWYRALVRSVSPTELRVLFVDYGNCEVVPRREVKRLKEEHCRLPAQAYSCRFAGVEPAGGQWKTLDEKQLAKYFNGDMTVTASSDASGSVSAVEVTLSGQKVTDMLVADGLAVRPQPGQTLKQQHLGPFTGLPNPFRSGDKLAVFVSYIVSPDRLYCQLSERAADIEQLETQIETAVTDGGKPLDGSAAAGAGCLAPFDGTFYRGVVVERTGSDAAVHFVDYGNTETVPAAELLECPEPLRRLPAQAIRLSLTGVPKDRTDDLTARADQMEFVARVDLVCADHLNVTLFDGETNVSVELGASATPAPAPTQAPTPAAPTPTPASVAPSPAPAATPSAPQKHLGPFTGLPNPFRSGDKLAVFVSYIVSPDRLYCQLSERAADIEQLETQIETAVADGGKPLVGSAAAGAGCLAPFDGTFYRGVVVERTGSDAAVHFVDYGNTETVPAAQLRECPEPLRRLPAQAIRLSLTGVPKDRTDDLTARADQMEFVARVDLVRSDHLNVTLFDGETNVNVELGASAAPARAPADQTPAPAAPAPAVTPAPAPAEPQKTVTAPQAEQPSPAPEARPIAVSFTVSPGEFYVQDAAAADQLDELMARLETEYTKLADGERAVNEVQPGDLLAAPFSEDGAFYRARVLAADSADTSQLHLQFIDYGNSERCARSACRLLTPPLLAPAPFAQRCRLAGAAAPAGGWTADAAAALDTLTGAPDGQVKMVTVSGDGDCWTVKLIGLGGEDVAKALVEAGHAAEESEESDKKVTDAPTEREEEAPRAEPAVEVTALTDLVPGRSVTVAVSFSLGPCEFWVQLLSNSARLDTLTEALEAAGELEPSGELPVAESPAAGQLVAVRYSVDCAMYRARLLPDSDSAESRRVLFVDYGNTESVPVGELRCLPPQLTEESLLAARCSLSLRVAEGAETAAAERFAELADSELELQMTLVVAGDPAIVTLTHEGCDLAGVLVEEGLAVPVEVSQKTEETREHKTADTDGDTKVNQIEVNTGDSEEPATESRLEDPGDHEVFVSHVNSPLEFYVQSPDTTALDDLMERLAAAAASLAPAEPPFEPTNLLAAPFSEDEALYRARVMSTTDDRARVQFVDYGNGEEVEAAALRRLPAELSELPPQALRCRLPVEACAASAVGRLRELTEEGARLTRLAASADADGPVALVRLTVDGQDVAETLAADGLCRLARRLTLPPALMPPLDTDMEVSVTFVGTDEVFVMLSDDRSALIELRKVIADLYDDTDPPPPLAAPAASDLCVVQDTNGGWNRATVLTVGAESTARVRLVDTGYILEGVALSDLRQPLQAVALPPPLVHCCHPAPDCDRHRVAEAGSLDGLVTVRFTADGDRLVLHLVTSGAAAAPEVSSAGQTTEQPAAEEGTSPASAEVSSAGQTDRTARR